MNNFLYFKNLETGETFIFVYEPDEEDASHAAVFNALIDWSLYE